MAARETVGNLKQQLEQVFKTAIKATVPNAAHDVHPLIAVSGTNFGDYQCNNAMGLFGKIRGTMSEFKNPLTVGEAIMNNLPKTEMIESCSVTGPGFVNIVLSKTWLAKSIQMMLREGIQTWAPKLSINTAVVDFSSPNIAKEMHVGHLRSTIIGDTLACMLEFCGVQVLRRNHVGDWGTQFGMLIEFLFEQFPQWEDDNEIPIKDLEAFYKQSKKRFDDDAIFKERAQKAVVSLQGGEPKYRKAWAQICEISRREFQKVYKRLGVHIEEKGESFYNPYISTVLEGFSNQGLIEESDGAQVIHVGKKIPLIVVKRDGGFNYASTDLTALWYRLNEEKAEWIIYVTDVGQQEHFEMFFLAAKKAGWLPLNDNAYPKVTHVGFGLVLGNDGKRFRTRSSEVVRLVDLLDEAKNRSKQKLIERGKAEEWTEEELDQTAEAVGYGAVKFADLVNNRLSNYTFSFDHMLNDQGKTAVYLLYAHARICSIIRKSGKDIEELKGGELVLDHADERALGLHLLRFSEIVEEACSNLLPSVLCDYLYNLSYFYTQLYNNCKVNGSAEETSRLLLCEATAVVMRKCFELLGITPVYKI
ncbi:arginine--tRNA ligase, chloroplastic/mitochondrial-like isoform X2 [Silene latifolia]|uniref:arginine--tRNA ligase, chloroplastic/mitochondrial-like isoform X2 n=1 Tax=Silene latifolia TaxID=37657 RepID=UPI003D773743